jgi:hypothetical protein
MFTDGEADPGARHFRVGQIDIVRLGHVFAAWPLLVEIVLNVATTRRISVG